MSQNACQDDAQLKAQRRDRVRHVTLRHQETVHCNAQAGVVVKAGPTPPLIMTQTLVLLQILVIALDAPAHVCNAHQITERACLWECR